MHLSTPTNWQDFETMVRDALALRWNSTKLQKNGRSGQKQDGVDIYGPDDLGRLVGIQCKRYKGPLKLEDVRSEIEKAELFKGILTTLFLATTGDYDARLQEQVRQLSEERALRKNFTVGLLFWDDIVGGLILNPDVFHAHFPQVQLQVPNVINNERRIAALELGFFGADLWQSITLVYGEYGLMTQADPDELITRLRIMERRVQQLLPPQDADWILDLLNRVREGCLAEKEHDSDWDVVESYARRASGRLQAASSLLALEESNVLLLGSHLGRIYHHADDLPPPDVRDEIEAKAIAVLGDASHSAVAQAFSSAAELTSGYRWAMRVYNFLNKEIRYRL